MCYITRLCRNSRNTIVSFYFGSFVLEYFCSRFTMVVSNRMSKLTVLQNIIRYLVDFSLFHCPLSTERRMKYSISKDIHSFIKQRDILAKVSKGWTMCFVQLENLQSSSHSNSFCLFVWNKYFAEFHEMNFLPVPAFSR